MERGERWPLDLGLTVALLPPLSDSFLTCQIENDGEYLKGWLLEFKYLRSVQYRAGHIISSRHTTAALIITSVIFVLNRLALPHFILSAFPNFKIVLLKYILITLPISSPPNPLKGTPSTCVVAFLCTTRRLENKGVFRTRFIIHWTQTPRSFWYHTAYKLKKTQRNFYKVW